MLRKSAKRFGIKDMATVSMCVAFLAVSSWITVPFVINFTLQTLAIFVVCSVFDIRISFCSILAYLIIGIFGLPVFSGFGSGFSALAGPTGGYLVGFLVIPIIMHFFLRGNRNNTLRKVIAMTLGLLCCYVIGALWYYMGFNAGADISFFEIFVVCVFPFLIPDGIKIFLAVYISKRLLTFNLDNHIGGTNGNK